MSHQFRILSSIQQKNNIRWPIVPSRLPALSARMCDLYVFVSKKFFGWLSLSAQRGFLTRGIRWWAQISSIPSRLGVLSVESFLRRWEPAFLLCLIRHSSGDPIVRQRQFHEPIIQQLSLHVVTLSGTKFHIPPASALARMCRLYLYRWQAKKYL